MKQIVTNLDNSSQHNSSELPKYTLSISLAVVKHLATNLYTDISSVLTEIVANAWDANATEVKIQYTENISLVIQDNGFGMSTEDINNKYLLIAYDKRKEITETPAPLSRKPMGRKGIGKLAPMNIADKVICESFQKGEVNALEIDYKELQKVIDGKHEEYHPLELECNITEGTRITLKNFKSSITMPREQTIRRQLSRKFSVIGSDDFKVYLNDKEITISDREDFEKVEYVWVFGEKSKSLIDDSKVIFYTDLEDAIKAIKADNQPEKIGFILPDLVDTQTSVLGWIGTSNRPGDLKTNYGSLNNIIVLARGRNIQNNILDDITEARIFKSYLTGTIEADFLDDDDKNDMASSAREALLKNDPRYSKLKMFLGKSINEIGNTWDKLRRSQKTKEQFKLFPPLRDWVDSLDNKFKEDAEKTLSAVVKLHPDDENKEKQKEILKATIYGFERLKARDLQAKMHESLNSNLSMLLTYLEDRQTLEGSLLYDITQSRLEAIEELVRLQDDDALEKTFQKHIAEHLWLLDSGWDIADNVPLAVEKNINNIFNQVVDGLSPKEQKGRLDIEYMTHAGKHIIIELKRASRKNFDIFELARQGQKYYSGLMKGLKHCYGENHYTIETIFIIGNDAYDKIKAAEPDEQNLNGTFKTCNGRIVTYNQLITNAQKQYQAYLENQEKAARLSKIVDKL